MLIGHRLRSLVLTVFAALFATAGFATGQESMRVRVTPVEGWSNRVTLFVQGAPSDLPVVLTFEVAGESSDPHPLDVSESGTARHEFEIPPWFSGAVTAHVETVGQRASVAVRGDPAIFLLEESEVEGDAQRRVVRINPALGTRTQISASSATMAVASQRGDVFYDPSGRPLRIEMDADGSVRRASSDLAGERLLQLEAKLDGAFLMALTESDDGHARLRVLDVRHERWEPPIDLGPHRGQLLLHPGPDHATEVFVGRSTPGQSAVWMYSFLSRSGRLQPVWRGDRDEQLLEFAATCQTCVVLTDRGLEGRPGGRLISVDLDSGWRRSARLDLDRSPSQLLLMSEPGRDALVVFRSDDLLEFRRIDPRTGAFLPVAGNNMLLIPGCRDLDVIPGRAAILALGAADQLGRTANLIRLGDDLYPTPIDLSTSASELSVLTHGTSTWVFGVEPVEGDDAALNLVIWKLSDDLTAISELRRVPIDGRVLATRPR